MTLSAFNCFLALLFLYLQLCLELDALWSLTFGSFVLLICRLYLLAFVRRYNHNRPNPLLPLCPLALIFQPPSEEKNDLNKDRHFKR